MSGRLNTLVIISISAFMASALFILRAEAAEITGSAGSVVKVEEYAVFDEPWAMTFLPDGEMLVTEKSGTLLLVSGDGSSKVPVDGVPEVAYGGQGGLGDIILHPDYATNSIVYLSYAEKGRSGKKGAAVAMAEFRHDPVAPALKNLRVVWRQEPKTSGSPPQQLEPDMNPPVYLVTVDHFQVMMTALTEIDPPFRLACREQVLRITRLR